jgi:hypothetical protein
MSALPGYTKLFADIITSTIWQESNDCRVLWITLLALKGRDHVCTATIPALARMCNISVEDCVAYIQKFESPDPYSRTKDFEGRRIQKVDGGWLILNGQRFTDKMTAESSKKNAIRVAGHRLRKIGKQLEQQQEAVAPENATEEQTKLAFLAKVLARHFFESEGSGLQEWAGLIMQAKVQGEQDVVAFISFCQQQGQKRGITSRYARFYQVLLQPWKERKKGNGHP